MSIKSKTLYEFGRFRLDPAERCLARDGRPVPLTPKAMEILSVLVENGNRLTTKEDLMTRVWPDSFVEEANLTVNVSFLRKLLGETAEGRPFIETVPKSGYRFAVPVRVLGEQESQSSEKPDPHLNGSGSPPDGASVPAVSAAELPSRSKRSGHRSMTTGIAVLLMALGSNALVRYAPSFRHASASAPRRLAILPFQNLRGESADDFLGFSLADAVITKLGYVSSLVVRPSYAVQKYQSQPPPMPRLAADLNVDTLLTGTFLHDGDALRISCQLIDVQSQNILWKGAFDLKYEKLLTVQDEVAAKVVEGLALTLPPSEAARLKPEQNVMPLAYEYYLRGVDLYSRNEFLLAIEMLRKSAELDPNYALTWAHLGRAYNADASFRFGGIEEYRLAQAAFERALSLQPDQLDSHIYMANMFTDTGQVEKSIPLLRQALRTNPHHAESHWELGYAYRFAGLLPESVAESERARQLDPGVKVNSSTLTTYLYLGQVQQFLDSLPKTDEVPLIVFYRGFAELYAHSPEDAARDFDRAFALDSSLLQAQIGKALACGIRGQADKGLALLHRVENKVKERSVGDPEAMYKIAQAYVLLGDKRSGLRVLKHSVENGFFPYPYLQRDSFLDGIREKSAFAAILGMAKARHEAFQRAFL